ncbi:hypothetical protein P3T24_006385 [Paraburkholderia sp. GAS33]
MVLGHRRRRTDISYEGDSQTILVCCPDHSLGGHLCVTWILRRPVSPRRGVVKLLSNYFLFVLCLLICQEYLRLG